jgi:uncharacterized membrane protein YfhO
MRDGLPDDLVVWEGGPGVASAEGSVEWLQAEPEQVRLRVNAPRETALVITDAFATGWSATLDGRPTTIYATNAAARGVLVSAGEHLVELEYHAPGFLSGLVLTAFGWLLCAALLAWARISR